MFSVLLLAASLMGADDDTLDKAAKKAAGMTNFTVKITTQAGGAKAKPQTTEARFDKDQPTAFKSDKDEAYKKGDILVYKDGDDWKKFERQKGSKGKNAPGVAAFLNLRSPTDELTDFGKKIKDARKGDAKDGDRDVYSGELTDDAAKEFGNPNRGGKGPDLTYSGTAKVWINADGSIVKYEIVVKATGTGKNGKAIDRSVTKTVEIGAVGSTKIDVPDGAKKVLEGAP